MRVVVCLALLSGCKFNVRPIDLPDAGVPDLHVAGPVDDLAEPADEAAPVDAAQSPDLIVPANPDLRSPAPDLGHSCGDLVKNGDESDTDCGGSCPRCSDGRMCRGSADCLSTHCLVNQCVQCLTGTQCGAPLEFCVKNVCDAMDKGQVAYWKLDETFTRDCATTTALDSSGNKHDGTDCPGTSGPTGGAAAKFGTGASFGPGEQHIDVPADPAFNTGTNDFTISLWVFVTSLAGDTPVFDSLSSPSTRQVLLHHAATGWAFEQRTAGGTTVVLNQNALTTTLNAWHHLALVRATNAWTLYLDGVSIATANNAIAIVATTGVVLGWSRDNSVELNGMLDDYRFYSRALTLDEVKAFSQ